MPIVAALFMSTIILRPTHRYFSRDGPRRSARVAGFIKPRPSRAETPMGTSVTLLRDS